MVGGLLLGGWAITRVRRERRERRGEGRDVGIVREYCAGPA